MAIRHGVLTGGVVTTVSFDADYRNIQVLNRTGTAEIFVTVDGENPTTDGDDVDIVPSAIAVLDLTSRSGVDTTVKLLSAGAQKYTVKAE